MHAPSTRHHDSISTVLSYTWRGTKPSDISTYTVRMSMYIHRKALVVIYGSNADDEKAEVKIKPTLKHTGQRLGLISVT